MNVILQIAGQDAPPTGASPRGTFRFTNIAPVGQQVYSIEKQAVTQIIVI